MPETVAVGIGQGGRTAFVTKTGWYIQIGSTQLRDVRKERLKLPVTAWIGGTAVQINFVIAVAQAGGQPQYIGKLPVGLNVSAQCLRLLFCCRIHPAEAQKGCATGTICVGRQRGELFHLRIIFISAVVHTGNPVDITRRPQQTELPGEKVD